MEVIHYGFVRYKENRMLNAQVRELIVWHEGVEYIKRMVNSSIAKGHARGSLCMKKSSSMGLKKVE